MKKYTLVFLATAAFCSGANAVTLGSPASDAGFGKMMNTITGAGQATISYGSNGTPLLTPSAATLATDGSAYLGVARTGSIVNAAGNAVPVNAVGKVATSSLGPLFKKAMGVLPIVGNLLSLVTLAAEVGFILNDQDGTVLKQNHTPQTDHYFAVLNDVRFLAPTPTASCEAFARTQVSNASATYYSNAGATAPDAQGNPGNCTFQVWNFGYLDGTTQIPAAFNHNQRADVFPMDTQGEVITTQPATQQDVADAIAAKSGWPTSSTLAAAAAAVLEAMPQTQPLPISKPVVTGPATSAGTSSTTVNPDGTKTTVSNTYNHSYAGDTITTVTNNTTTNYDINNNVINQTTTAATPSAPTKTQCETNPDSAGCASLGDVPKGETLSKKDFAVQVVAQTFATGSGCPPPIQFTAMGHSYALPYDRLCGWLALVKPIFAALGALLAAYILADSFKVS